MDCRSMDWINAGCRNMVGEICIGKEWIADVWVAEVWITEVWLAEVWNHGNP